MYPVDIEDQPQLEQVRQILSRSVHFALTSDEPYSAIAIYVKNEEQRRLGKKLAEEMAKELGKQCQRTADRVIFLHLPHPEFVLGTPRLFENYLIPENQRKG